MRRYDAATLYREGVMSRAARLLALLDLLRQHRRPVAGQVLAEGLGVSLRTLYRDIATLQGQGALIEGEAGLGYVLQPGFMLPPLMFSVEEIAALMLGVQWVARQGDASLASAAGTALSRIAAVLPEDLRRELHDDSLIIPPGPPAPGSADIIAIRAAIRAEHRLELSYRDKDGAASDRAIWPISIAFFAAVRVVVGWCELRQDFRHFRVDRIAALTDTGSRYPRRRRALMKEWRELMKREAADRN